MIYRRAIPLNASSQCVFDWHTRPGSFERLTPPWNATRLLEKNGTPPTPGSTVKFQIKVGPMWLTWLAEHGQWTPGAMFSDRQLSGPFRSWEHIHEFKPCENGSQLEDCVRYSLPFGLLGRMGADYAQREIDRLFSYRHRVTAADIECHAQHRGEAMNVLVSGSSGLIGSALTSFLGGGGHQVRKLKRSFATERDEVLWNPTDGNVSPGVFEGIDAVVHLAGESIAGGRWNKVRKANIRNSRIEGTRRLCDSLALLDSPPRVLVSASAIGYYGDRGDEKLNELAAPGVGFLSDVCREWEQAVAPARESGVRVVNLRIGIVMSPRGGALAQMLTPFKLGLGGVLGTGNQYMSWIAPDDVVGIILHALTDSSIEGPVNAVSPNPVTNRTFTKTLGAVLSRPTILPTPTFGIRLLFGEMADALLLSGQRVVPRVLESSGFKFKYPELEGALRHVLGR